MALITSIILSGCLGKEQEQKQEEPTVAVQTIKIETSSIKKYSDVSSKIISQNNVNVTPKASGTIKKLYVKIGQKVNKGDIIAKIDDTDLTVQLQQADAAIELAKANASLSTNGSLQNSINQMKAQVDSLQIQLNDAQTNLNRMKELFAAGAVAQADLEKAQMGVDTLTTQLQNAQSTLNLNQTTVTQATQSVGESAIKQAEAARANIKNMINNTTVKAEGNGTITNLMVSEGNAVGAGTPIATIADGENLKVSLQVSQELIDKIGVGTPVEIILDGQGTSVNAVVSNLSKSADAQTALYPVEINLRNDTGNLYSGMFVTARIISDSKDLVITLPLNSVLEDNDKKYVYVIKGDGVVKTTVATGIQNVEKIEIIDGLKIGDEVVVKGQDFLSETSKINIVNEVK